MEIKECASSRFKDDNKEKAKHVDAPCENKRHAGSTPATSTILPFNYAVQGPHNGLLSDSCQKIEYPSGTGIYIKSITNTSAKQKYFRSYQVYIPELFTGNKRIRKQFKSFNLAKDYADLVIKGQKKLGEVFFEIDPKSIIKKKTKLSVSLSEIIEEIIALKNEFLEKGTIRPKTEKSFRIQAKAISRYFEGKQVASITSEGIKVWVRSMSQARRTKENYLNTLREILNYAHSRSYISENPARSLSKIDIKELLGVCCYKEPSILTVEQTQLALKTAREKDMIDIMPALILGFFCGLRTEELKRINWDNINLKERFVTIDANIAKKRRIRNVSIPNNAIQLLTPFYRKGEYVSPNKYCSEFDKKFRKLKLLLNFKWGNNAMRHSFGSYHFALYGDSIKTSREMGHLNGDDVLFSYYRKLVSQTKGQQYFDILV